MAGVTEDQDQPATNGHITRNISPRITLYTNHRCPYAHRAHIALGELNLPFEEVIIDLDAPRPQWYLDINPRGVVPSIKYSVPGVMDEEIVTESAIVSQFLCDSFPSHVLPASKETPTSALRRARINFFCDTWNTKVSFYQMSVIRSPEGEKEAKCKEWIDAIKKEIEPLLADAAPFFGGSKELTFAEVITAPFVMRWWAFANDGELLPKRHAQVLESECPNLTKWKKAIEQRQSVMKIYDEEKVVSNYKAKMKNMQGAKK